MADVIRLRSPARTLDDAIASMRTELPYATRFIIVAFQGDGAEREFCIDHNCTDEQMAFAAAKLLRRATDE